MAIESEVISTYLRTLGVPNQPEKARFFDGNHVHIVMGAITVARITGYPILTIYDPNGDGSHLYHEQHFLPELVRSTGANGSTANVDLSSDQINSLLLIHYVTDNNNVIVFLTIDTVVITIDSVAITIDTI